MELEDTKKVYFEILYQPDQEKPTYIYPSAQQSSEDESILYRPYILHTALRDIYTHVRTYALPEEAKWSNPKKIEVAPKAQFFANDYVASVVSISKIEHMKEVPLDTSDIAIRAEIEVLGPDQPYYLYPVLVVKGSEVGLIADELPDLGIRVMLRGIYPKRDRIELEISSSQLPWVILEVVEKPLINLLWGGSCLMIIGIGLGLAQYLRGKKKV